MKQPAMPATNPEQPRRQPGPRTSLKPLCVGFLVSTVVVFLQFGPYLGWLLRADVQEWHLWRARDTLQLFGTILALGFVLAIGGWIVRRLNRAWLSTAADHLLLTAVGAGLITNLWYHTSELKRFPMSQHGGATVTLWILLSAVVAYSLARPRLRLPALARAFCVILSPALLVVAAQFLGKPTYPKAMDPFPPTTAASVVTARSTSDRVHPVYIFVFDEWSYRRTFENRKVAAGLTGIAAFADRSVVFHNAVSPSRGTMASIPRMLYGVDWPVVFTMEKYGFERDGAFVPGSGCESIFREFAGRGYRTMMIGAAYPYRALLGDQVDICRAECWVEGTRSDNVLAQGLVDLFRATGYWADPWSPFLRSRIGSDWPDYRQTAWGFERLLRDLDEIVHRQPHNTFAVIHYPAPHGPWIVDERGGICPREEAIWQPNSGDMFREGYRRSLSHLDGLVGRIVSGLRQRDLFDDSLLILTSDHDWRSDPDEPYRPGQDECRHVPLLVKLPGQTTGLAISETFETRHLREVVRFALGPDNRPEMIQSLVAELRARPPVSTAPAAVIATR